MKVFNNVAGGLYIVHFEFEVVTWCLCVIICSLETAVGHVEGIMQYLILIQKHL